MAALTITATQVLLASGPTKYGTLGVAVTAGQSVYFDATTGTWKLAQGDGSAAEAGADGYGIALNGGAAGQPVLIALPGAKVTLGAGAAPAAGVVYSPGDTAGSLCPPGDMGSTDKVLPLCIGTGSNAVKVLGEAYDAGAVIA